MSKKRKGDSDLLAMRLVKAEADVRMTFGVVYPVNKADVSRAADGFRDYAGPDAVRRAAWSFFVNRKGVGLYHDDRLGDQQAQPVESFLWRGPSWTTKAADGSTVTISEGDWCMTCIWSEEAWPLVKSGAIRGFSMQGAAQRRRPSKSDLAKLR